MMPFLAFEGPAGTGKTYQLIEEVRARAPRLLGAEQRVLGLTFMHGSRRRLEESFATKAEIRGRGYATTIDSFATHMVRRWSPVGPPILDFTQFDQVCDACGALLERPEIGRWVSAAFPIVVIDEAQELKPCRLRIARALSDHAHMVVAADEFQCLDDQVDTGPCMAWLDEGNVQRLTIVRRTARRGLLDAGLALRGEQPLVAGVGLRIRHEYPNQVKFTVGHALLAGVGTRAVLVAPGSTAWANELVCQLAEGFQSEKQRIPPLPIAWDTPPKDEANKVASRLCEMEGQVESIELVRRIKELPDSPSWLSTVAISVAMARRAQGVRTWSHLQLLAVCMRKANVHRAYSYSPGRGIRAMTIQGAKNRQFRDVVVLWGPGVPGGPDYHRRLLYNAITRAEHSCTGIVRTERQLQQLPFV
jgi:AAA domain/UvrD-like helicase C-terminal domain